MNQTKNLAKDLLSFMKHCTSPFHVVKEGETLLQQAGFKPLDMNTPWKLQKGHAYYVNAYDTTLFAFRIGKKFAAGDPIHLACAHTDYPCLHVKPKAEMHDHGYLKLDIEVYGGAILNTWLDRPLSIAGKVTLRSDYLYQPKTLLVDFARPLVTIPNLAIHMNREVNKGVELNKQTEMLPIIGLLTDKLDEKQFFLKLLAKECKVKVSDILDFDLVIYNAEDGCLLGLDNELLSCPRLDNLTSCYSALSAIAASVSESSENNRLNMIALFDNEEIGSRSKQGADSMLANLVLEKIYDGLSYPQMRLTESFFDSLMLSMDVAHAYHPNYGAKNDPNHICECGKGLVLKLNYNQKYATDTQAIGMIKQLCEANRIPYQTFVNRADQTGGSTLGTITSAFLPMRTVDLGIGILAMHSARELMGIADQVALNDLVYCFFL